MKLVTFAAPLAPFVGGERRLVPDQVAKELDDEGCLSAMEDWPPAAAGSEGGAERPRRATLQPTRPMGRGGDRRLAR